MNPVNRGKKASMKPAPPIFRHHPLLTLLENLPVPISNKRPTVEKFKQIHSQFITTGLSHHTYPLSRLISHSLSPSSVSLLPDPVSYSLSLLFSDSSSPHPPSTFLLNTLISHLSFPSHTHLALSLYSRHLLHSPLSPPNPHTFPSLLKACSSSLLIFTPYALALHAHILKLHFLHHPHILTSLLHFHSLLHLHHNNNNNRSNNILTSLLLLFRLIPSPDLPSWNSILSAHSRLGASLPALLLFRGMLSSSLSRLQPNEITLVAVATACGDLGTLSQGLWVHCYILRRRLSVNCFLGTALVDMYAKCGRLDLAQQVFADLQNRDTMCYNAMICGLATHGQGHAAVELFHRMGSKGVRVDDVTLVVLMSACAHAGLVDEGREFFDRMGRDFGIVAKGEHYGCLVDLLGRAGRLEEAEKVVEEMPLKPNAALYRSLLGACRVHGNVEMGERLIARVLQLEPDHGGNYVLHSNLYADVRQWDDVGRVRTVMRDKGIIKTPGLSSVEMDGAIHEFAMGDQSHFRTEEIYAMLDEIGRRLHEFGHRARTKEVLLDVEDEDKEDALSYHSERLAIAFALVASDAGAPIRIVKNLRVCSDCHSITKLISLIYGREIIVRDRIRFHHFRNGACSCLDYW